jgi:cytochrome c oxidase cbb3-type subunit 1
MPDGLAIVGPEPMPHNRTTRTQEDLRAPMAVNPKKLRPYDEPPKVRRSLIPSAPDTSATLFMVVSLLWLAVATGIGMLWVATLVFPDQVKLALEFQVPIIGTLAIDVSRQTVESGFVNALVFGWLSNAGFAAILFITPRLVGHPLVNEAMGFGAVGMWNLGLAAGLATIYLPQWSHPGLLTEIPWLIDGLMLLGLFTVFGAFNRTLLAGERTFPYVSILFFELALLAFLGVFGLGTLAELLPLNETADALVSAFLARAISTYWVLGIALGALFYVVPRASLNPLASGGMALLAWLLWAAFAGLSAIGALVDPSIPFVITSMGHVGTMLLVAPIFLVVANLALTLQGRWSLALTTGTLAFALISMVFLLGVGLLEAVGALRSVQELVRGTEWEIGAWLLGSLGAATFALFAAIDHAAPRALRRDWRHGFTVDAQLWAMLAGAALAAFALIGGGIAHGSLLAEGAAQEDINGTLIWFRAVAGAGLGLAALSAVSALASIFLIYTTARRAEYHPAEAGGEVAAAPAAH